ncbi:MAG TPA: EF-hand domain-containing protein, partial [Stellaceae bacterium]|nr:EF-hand domain-containing protein [Stellaceae bacterium]
MRRFGRAVLAAALTFAIGACHPFGDRRPVVRQGPIFSPNGEPLSGGPLGDPSCKDAMQKWLARVDANHDGTIEVSEFMADARRQFSAMDLDKSGVLTPDILARYRAPYASARGDEFASDGEERRH